MAACTMMSVIRQGCDIYSLFEGMCVFKNLYYKRQHQLWAQPPTHPLCFGMDTGVRSWRESGRSVKLTTELHLVPRLRVSGAISFGL
jgi:hypothetical protein